MSALKGSLVYTALIILLIVLVKCGGTIFPIMSESECFQDEYACLHNNNCPYRSVPWFTIKEKKLSLLIKKDIKFCRECFSDSDVKKCVYCHRINLDNLIKRYNHSRCSKQYIKNRIEMYETGIDKDINDWYK